MLRFGRIRRINEVRISPYRSEYIAPKDNNDNA